VPVIPIPEQIAVLRYGINDLTKASGIVRAAEDGTEVLPAVADRVAGIRVPARPPRTVALAIAMVGVPEQIAVTFYTEDGTAAAVEVTEVSPAVADRVAGIRVPARPPRTVTLAIAMVGVPEQVAVLRHRIDCQPARTGRALLRRDEDVPETLPPVPNWVPRVGVPAQAP